MLLEHLHTAGKTRNGCLCPSKVSILILIKYTDTPLVRASGLELFYVILGGILLCYLNTFILLAKPGMVVCALQR